MMEPSNKKKNRKKHIALIIILCILVPIIVVGSYYYYILYLRKAPTIVPVGDVSSDAELIDLPKDEESGIDNIVLFGVDDRKPGKHGNTDSIMIATVDKNAKLIKLTSIMRDLYVPIGSTKNMNRINSAYSAGGAELALKTLNNNFGLDLKYYAIIDFFAFQELVDELGGVDVEVKDYEVDEINYYIKSVNGSKAKLLGEPGFQHLNGQQALSYSRIRKVGNGDWERTERQRTVIKCLAEKVKKVNIMKVPQLLTTLTNYVQTNVSLPKIISLGTTAYKFSGGIESMRIPVEGYYEGQEVHGAQVLVPDINANAHFIKEFIYDIKVAAYKDVPPYMQNNFHMDDGVTSSKPKPNIPDYSTPNIPSKSDDEQSIPIPDVTPAPKKEEKIEKKQTPDPTPTPIEEEEEATPIADPTPADGEASDVVPNAE